MTTSITVEDMPDAQRPRRRRRWMVPAVFVLILVAVLGRGVFAEEAPSTMLGGSAAVPGGLARINGVKVIEAWVQGGETIQAGSTLFQLDRQSSGKKVALSPGKRAAGRGGKEDDVDKFMRGSVSPSKKPEMDCVAGLLSLSQGAWR